MKFLRFAALAAVLAPGAAPSQAADFPERPVQIVTPYAAGGGLDTITRTLAQRLSALWGQQVIVDNRPGAGSTIGTAFAAKARPDGYTLLVGSTPLGIAPVVYPNLAYDARRDFAPISLIGTTPEVLVVHPGLGVGTIAELVALAKKDARKLNFGSAGSGTLAHLAAEAFNRRAELGGAHIPYKGSNPALVDLIGGQIDWVFDTPTAVLPHVRSGKLRALAVAAAQRSPQLPNVPTLGEAGYPELDFRIWMALLARPERRTRSCAASRAALPRSCATPRCAPA
jgi:tripartite-type tricarboxylate transporter receptor subunit TctC